MDAAVWQTIQSDIKHYNARCVAVSKKQPLEKIQTFYALGQRDFGENYAQEGIEKIQALNDLDITWHFLGAIQSNKTKQIATYFNWVQGVDRIEIAERLNRHCSELKKHLNICVSVNIDQEPQKSGVGADELPEFLSACRAYEHLRLRGMMVLPKPRDSEADQRKIFTQVKKLYDDLIDQGFELDTLSMGMSNDYRVALECGSNMVRIGTALFGERL